jgi:hypothetical protein
MGPHAKYFDNPFVLNDLIDETVLNIDTARECAAQIPEKFLKRRRSPKRIFPKHAEKLLRL